MDYRTFGILLLDPETQDLEMKLALKFGEPVTIPKVRLGEGLVGYAALHRDRPAARPRPPALPTIWV